MNKKKILGFTLALSCCVCSLVPNIMHATNSLDSEVGEYLASDKGKSMLEEHKDINGKTVGYKYTVNHSSNIVTITYDDGYITTFKYTPKSDETEAPSNSTDKTVVYVNGYPVPKYIMEAEDSALNAREIYMKYNGDPKSFDESMTPGNKTNIPSEIDENGNAVSMNDKRTTNCWVDGKYYDSRGYNVTGWKNIKNNWYYFSPDGIVQKGWKYLNSKWYFLENDGRRSTGWRYIKQKWYFFNQDGEMQTGWVHGGHNVWYHLKQDGSMTVGWVKDKGKWYYMNSNGVMHTAWLKYKNKWYYLNPNDGAMKTGWVHLSKNKWYYLKSDGSMVDYNFTLKGVKYKVANDGSCTW